MIFTICSSVRNNSVEYNSIVSLETCYAIFMSFYLLIFKWQFYIGNFLRVYHK